MTQQAVLEAVQVALATPLDTDRSRGPGRTWVGFSGGLDSSVLLDAAVVVGVPRLGVVHVDHQLHADSGSWAAHCQEVCAGYGLECHVRAVRIGTSGNLEQRARDARFEVFESLLDDGDRLLLGHHADDQGETVLFRLLRGGSARPGGMSDCRRLGPGWLLRPFLGLPQDVLTGYARARGLAWLEDPSNTDTAFDRNFLRRQVLPRVRERWPDAATVLSRTARQHASEAALLDHFLDAALEGLTRGDCLSWRDAASFPQPERLVRRWLERAGFHGTRSRALEEFLRQVAAGAGAPELRLAEQISLRAFNELLYLVRDVSLPARFEQPMNLSETAGLVRVSLPHGRLEAVCVAPSDRATRGCVPLVAGDYLVRPRHGGERLRSGTGTSRSVKRLLAEAAVPVWRRPDYPLIWAGGTLAAVPGIGVATEFVDAAGWSLNWCPEDSVRGAV